MTAQLASCAAAEALDAFLIRPGCLAGAVWLARPLPGGVWLGFAAGKTVADLAWYATEAAARRGLTQSLSAAQPATPCLLLDPALARDRFAELAAALPGVRIHYAVKANPHPRLLACLHAAGCRFEAASWAEVRAAIRAGADPATVLFTHPVKPAADIARAWKAGVWRFAADSGTELRKIALNAPGSAVLLRIDTGTDGTVGDQGKFGIPPGQAPGLARLARALGLNPYGLAFHVGSQTMDPQAWDGPIRYCAQIMTALAADEIMLAMVDVGGGFPVHYDTDPPPLARYAAAINDAAAHLPYPGPARLRTRPGDRRPRRDHDRDGDRHRLARSHTAGQPGYRRVPRPDRSARVRPRTALPYHRPRCREPGPSPLHADRAQLRQPGHHLGPGVAAHAPRRRPGTDRQRRRVHHLLLRPQRLQRLPGPGRQDHHRSMITRQHRLPGVHADPHPDRRAGRPPVRGQCPLHLQRAQHCLRRAAEHHEEPIPRRIHLMAAMGGDRRADQPPVLGQDLRILFPQGLDPPRRTLNVAEQEGDHTIRQPAHPPPPPRTASRPRHKPAATPPAAAAHPPDAPDHSPAAHAPRPAPTGPARAPGSAIAPPRLLLPPSLGPQHHEHQGHNGQRPPRTRRADHTRPSPIRVPPPRILSRGHRVYDAPHCRDGSQAAPQSPDLRQAPPIKQATQRTRTGNLRLAIREIRPPGGRIDSAGRALSGQIKTLRSNCRRDVSARAESWKVMHSCA